MSIGRGTSKRQPTARSVWSAPYPGAFFLGYAGKSQIDEMKAPGYGALQTLRAVRAWRNNNWVSYLAEISSICSIGNRARSIMCFGSSILGANFAMQSRTFCSVFIFIYLHSLH